jgi:hypothetical protein
MHRITLLIPFVFIMIEQVYADVDSFTDRLISASGAIFSRLDSAT